MTITINGNAIDYTLENEKTLHDVLLALSSWMQEQDMVMRSVKIDGIRIELTDRMALSHHSLESIDHLNIHAISTLESQIFQIQTAQGFFQLLSNAIKSHDKENMTHLLQYYDDLRNVILPNILELESFITIRQNPQEYLDDPEKSKQILSAIDDIISVLKQHQRKMINEEKADKNPISIAKKLADLAHNLDDVALQLQTGRDQSAMATIILLTELLHNFYHILEDSSNEENIVISEEFGATLSQIKEILSQMEEAMKVNDSVLIGDLLEYELKPQLETLPDKVTSLESADLQSKGH